MTPAQRAMLEVIRDDIRSFVVVGVEPKVRDLERWTRSIDRLLKEDK